jgi:hypothetical protein
VVIINVAKISTKGDTLYTKREINALVYLIKRFAALIASKRVSTIEDRGIIIKRLV